MLSSFAYGGTWNVGGQAATAVHGASLSARVHGKDVYLVLSPPAAGGGGRVAVALDGRPIASRAGSDVRGGVVSVRSQRLYHLVHLIRAESHTLTLRFAPGTAGYAFTFG